MTKTLTTLLLLPLLAACQSQSSPNPADTLTLWVDGQTQTCSAGAGKMECLLVWEDETLPENPQWQYFYNDIEGFTFQEGVRQKILVRQAALHPDTVPADGSSTSYQLIKVLDTMLQPKQDVSNQPSLNRLNDIWAVTKILNHPIPTAPQGRQRPYIELHLRDKRIMGTDGCNRFTGSISALDNNHLQFGLLATTRMMCADMQTPNAFHRALNKVTRYQLEGLTLSLQDNAGKEVMRLRKVD